MGSNVKRFEYYPDSTSSPRHTSSWNVTGRVLVSANAFRILLTRAWNLSALRSLLYFPSSRTIRAASSYATTLIDVRRFKEAKRVLLKVLPVVQRALGTEHDLTLSLREDLCRATLYGESSTNEKRKALQMLEDTVAVMRRVLGPAHPDTSFTQRKLERYRRRFSTK